MQGNYTTSDPIRKRSILQSQQDDSAFASARLGYMAEDLIDAMNEVIHGDLNAPGAGMIIPLDPTGMAW